MVGSEDHYKYKEYKLDTLKTVLQDKTILVGGGTVGMSFIEMIPEAIRVLTLLMYLFYVCIQVYKEIKK